MEYESRDTLKYSPFYAYMCQEADKKKPKEEKKIEGDGRIAEDKSLHKGDWGKHAPTHDRPADRDKKKFKPWKKKV